MKKLSILLVFLFGMLTATASIHVEPARFEFVLNNNERTTEAIRVTNFSQLPLTISVNAYDWYLTESGDFVNSKLGSLDSTLLGHIKFNPRQFTLTPGQTQIVRVTIDMPDTAPLQRRSVIFFESQQSSFSGNFQTIFQTLVGTTVYVTNKQAVSSLEILSFEHQEHNGDYMMLQLSTKNSGDTHLRVNVSYSIYDLGDQLLHSGEKTNTILLPGQKHSFYLPVETELVPGLYNVVGKITFTDTMNFIPFTFPITISK